MTATEAMLVEDRIDELVQEYIEEIETADYYGIPLHLMAS